MKLEKISAARSFNPSPTVRWPTQYCLSASPDHTLIDSRFNLDRIPTKCMGVMLRRHSQVRLYYGAWGNRGTGMNLSRLTMLGCLSLLCMSCGGGASQATETVQASQTIQTTGSTTSANDSSTAAGNACTNFNGVNSFGQQIVNTEACTLNHDGIERDYFIHVPDQQLSLIHI